MMVESTGVILVAMMMLEVGHGWHCETHLVYAAGISWGDEGDATAETAEDGEIDWGGTFVA